jgi:predicted RNA-binding Zn-ribbon protein involved in translation (DUF1610 family)
MTWQRWMCRSCGAGIELNDESPIEAWCPSCNEHMVPLDLDDEAEG